ncbi:MAG: TrkH family potassium uptake protein [Clostridiales bacterium]|nr:TrkH family potassium uptake protein [Candidatus Crickella caballi]
MNRRMIANVVGISLLLESMFMALTALVCVHYGEDASPFMLSVIVTAAAGAVMRSLEPYNKKITSRDGFVMVAFVWIGMSVCGALPFFLSGEISSPVNAFFETVSGFTTTGATILTDIEAMSRGCLFWRSFTHWIGGMGILVFIMALIPMSGDHSMYILKAEVPGPTSGKIVPRAKDTTMILYLIYTVMTLLETVLLKIMGMGWYDALIHAFGTAGTGGFSTKNTSIAAFNSFGIEMVIAVFLILFGINFNLYYYMVVRKFRNAFKSEELYVYLGIVAASVILISSKCGFRDSFFAVASIITTAGYSTADFTLWPVACQMILVLLMFIGACAGSTGGGLKVSRILIMFKGCASRVSELVRTRSVSRVRIDGKVVDSKIVFSAYAYFFLYIVILFGGCLLVSLDGFDFETNITATLSCISNIGPGLGKVGPSGNFAIFSNFSKLILSFVMLAGRLELYPILILFSPGNWKLRKFNNK